MAEGRGSDERPGSSSSSAVTSHGEGEAAGDYSARMEELFDDENELEEGFGDDCDDEAFVYDGVDAERVAVANYQQQLRAVLEKDDSDDNSRSPPYDVASPKPVEVGDAALQQWHGQLSPEASPVSSPPPTMVVHDDLPSEDRLRAVVHPPQPFVHPSVSRLRSVPPPSPAQSTNFGLPPDSLTPTGRHSPLSHASNISRVSSPLRHDGELTVDGETFRWTSLQTATSQLFGRRQSKAALLLGASNLGSPTVLAANGLICVGTDAGRILVFDFKQTLLCMCGNDSASRIGPVSALALSHDHTYVASGHESGYVQLFNLKHPHSPVRTIAPAPLPLVLSGKQEGHLAGSCIVDVAFVAGRHTAIISADEYGLAFYHNLGKILFVEASDTIRILGNYPQSGPTEGSSLQFRSFRRWRLRNPVLSMEALPLGTAPHPTDAYQLVAMLTPSKLIVVGMRPTPKTWLKHLREGTPDSTASDRYCGTLAWFPSIKANEGKKNDVGESTSPVIAYSWGKIIQLMRVSETKIKQVVTSSRTGKKREIEVGALVFQNCKKWVADDAVLALQWLNMNQLVVFTAVSLLVYDVRTTDALEHVPFDTSTLLPRIPKHTNHRDPESIGDIAHAVRTHKGKIFLLKRSQLQVGTLSTWADKILSCVERGDFLKAIDITRAYYTGEAPGNRNGLPDDPEERTTVLQNKLHELMVASARYVFSEDRMTDGTHFSPDGRGVDRTFIFEGLVVTCARACIAMSNYDFLFEELFQYFDNSGISQIYLGQLEAFVLDGTIRSIPPWITQRLVALHDGSGRLDLAERIIWHIEPTCLDINQAIRLCQANELWDALIYIYTRALHDYVSPIVELLPLIRKTLAFRQQTNRTSRTDPMVKLILAESHWMSGEAHVAMKDIYHFVFNGRSAIWPPQGGSLILTSDDSGTEPTYPYARLLLRFDAESFLHCLDLAFESSFFNDDDESHDVSRLWIVTILSDIISDSNLTPFDITFVNIFIARNVPKYSQDIRQPPSILQNLLISLATSMDASTREDRQLAAEYLLSVYNPNDSVFIMKLFEDAGFHRILQRWHRQERRWPQLLQSYLDDSALGPLNLFMSVDEVLALSMRGNNMTVPSSMIQKLTGALGPLLQSNMRLTAILIDKFAPALHQTALDTIGPADRRKQYEYLVYLFDPQTQLDEEDNILLHRPDLPNIDKSLQRLFVTLQCHFAPPDVIDTLDRMRNHVDWSSVEQICEENRAYGAVLWAMSQRGFTQSALLKAAAFEKRLTFDIVQTLTTSDSATTDVGDYLSSLLEIGRRGTTMCLEQSAASGLTEVILEDIWFQLLSSQLQSIHTVSTLQTSGLNDAQDAARTTVLSTLRGLVQETFASFVSISSTQAVSFPRIFKRLVDPGLYTGSSSGTPYTEFRTILTSMLESYRTDEDMLVISKHLLSRDVFDTVEEYTKEKLRGWSASHSICTYCHNSLLRSDIRDGQTDTRLVISRSAIYHKQCAS
ncbi:Golgi CORVET complex core vacuolar protein 8-domain-containing protein [Pisolithus marmoratus]|nr:Golgi CORVET complex core vacuolar protein 8-domain-containing protein [Pisolithus marmoratus]